MTADFGGKTKQFIDGVIKFAKEINGKTFLIYLTSSDISLAIGNMVSSISLKWKK